MNFLWARATVMKVITPIIAIKDNGSSGAVVCYCSWIPQPISLLAVDPVNYPRHNNPPRLPRLGSRWCLHLLTGVIKPIWMQLFPLWLPNNEQQTKKVSKISSVDQHLKFFLSKAISNPPPSFTSKSSPSLIHKFDLSKYVLYIKSTLGCNSGPIINKYTIKCHNRTPFINWQILIRFIDHNRHKALNPRGSMVYY